MANIWESNHKEAELNVQASESLPRYDYRRDYDWNYDHAPEPVHVDVPSISGAWRFCGLPVDSPLGVPAGPLLNGKWLLYYAGLGFDVLTYKTVRGIERACYGMPNLQPVTCGDLTGKERELPATDDMRGSWAVSFGMPSKAPATWMADVERTKDKLPAGKVLSVSVVGTVQEGWSIERLADDYAQCARWAVDSGADVIEINFSCPNVATCDGQLYQQPTQAAMVAAKVRDATGDVPLVIKVGHLDNDADIEQLLQAVSPAATALAMTNSVATTVTTADGRLLFDGAPRGICGAATRAASLRQTARFRRVAARLGLAIELIGVGGASTAEHVRQYLDAGATAVHLATAAMVRPAIACEIRRDLARADD